MSDHISGPRALADPIADITDLYAFPSPERPGWLTLVMNTLPFAPAQARFSDGLLYRFRLRPAHLDQESRTATASDAPEWQIDLTFDAPGDDGQQRGVCLLPTGEQLSVEVGNPEAFVESPTARVFAGPRWDPFIMDAPAGLRTIAERRLCFSDQGKIYLDGKNVLSVVVDLDCAAVLGRVEPLAVVGETLTRGRFVVRIERVGRPEVKNLLLGPKQFDQVNRDLEIRDLYNLEDAFHLGSSYTGAYRARLDANLAFWDGLDGQIQWPLDPSGTHPLTELVLADHLIVDPSRPYAESGSFLEIERSTMRGESPTGCGGRTLNDDVIDTLYTLWITGDQGPVIRDGVDAATRPASSSFPYLATPNPSPPTPPEHH